MILLLGVYSPIVKLSVLITGADPVVVFLTNEGLH
jgi:hypothetical protein